jgi:hypothetical protein
MCSTVARNISHELTIHFGIHTRGISSATPARGFPKAGDSRSCLALYAPKPPNTDVLDPRYMDLHLLSPKCGIGIHRQCDNQEVFLLLKGSAVMVVGQLHALYNQTDEQIQLFMFGGYD